MLKCEYCGSPITELDKICPVCGADLVAAHEQIAREKDQVEDKKIEDAIEEKQEKAERRLKPAKSYVKHMAYNGILTIIGLICAFIYIKATVLDKWDAQDKAKQEAAVNMVNAEPAGLDEWAQSYDLRYKIDKYAIFSLSYDGDGITIPYRYQRIAFYVTVENTNPRSNVEFKKDGIGCIADGMVQETSEVSSVVENIDATDGTEVEFKKLSDCTIGGSEIIEGWIAFKIPQSKKTLEFRLPNGMRIVMDNPCYEEWIAED